jgi:basic membrane protein A
MLRSLARAAALAAFAVAAQAQEEIDPAVVYDLGGKFDRSFNEAAYRGAEAFREETGVEYRDFEIQNDAQREQALRRFARQGHDPIIAIGFSHGSALEKVAPDFPETRFAIVDSVVDEPNVRSILFQEHEGSYLAGVMAAMAAKARGGEDAAVGFVGGMDIPLIRKFACGYAAGAKSVDPEIEVFQNMTGNTGAAWNDPAKGAELTRSQIERGAEVIYHAAGGTGVGVLQAAADAGKLGVGVDSNQNMLQPGSVLTSMVKAVDVAVQDAFHDAMRGEWTAGVETLGLAEGGVGVAMDEHNEDLVTEEMAQAVEQAEAGIVSGEITVHDYMSDQSCPY